MREGLLVEPAMPVFMPARMLGTPKAAATALPQPAPRPVPVAAPGRSQAGLIEIELGDGCQARVDADVDPAALRRVLAALPR